MNYIAASVEITCIIISITIMLFFIAEKRKETYIDKLFISMLICNIVMLTADCNTYFVTNPKLNFLHYLNNYIAILGIFVVAGLYTIYIVEFIKLKHDISPWYERICVGIVVAGIAFNVVQMFTHMAFYIDSDGTFVIQKMFVIYYAFGVVMVAYIALLVTLNYKKLSGKDSSAMLSFCTILVACFFLQAANPSIPFVFFAMTLCLFIIYTQTHIGYYRQLKETEADLAEARLNIAMSQIQPHFIYNSLATIATLCVVDPKQAQRTTVDFSNYLRVNLDSMENRNPIPFSKELKHVQTYLALEKMRFEERLNVVYDIECEEFIVPPLSIQPLAENAVRHGVCKKAGGGTVKISTKELKHSFIVVVEDDGVGFDTTKPHNDERVHIGVSNVKKRVEELVGGSLEIVSTEGVGTTATLIIPKNASRYLGEAKQ